MSLTRVGILLGKELLQGPKNYIFTMAVVLPIVLSLVVSLAFGTLFAAKPRLGIVDEGDSLLVAMAGDLASIETRQYATDAELRRATANGAVDIGIVLPAGFVEALRQGREVEIKAYVWGESLAKDRTILGVSIINLVRELAGHEAPVEVATVTLGDEAAVPWHVRLFPLIVTIAVFLGGLMLPATSVITEKEKKTLVALLVTPTTALDVFVAKGLVGLILSLFAGIAILLLNDAFGAQPPLLLLLLALGAIMAAVLGLLLGAVMKDWATLFTVWKTGGIVLFGPAFIHLFPQIPEWVARVFPTYYLIQPLLEISQRGAGWSDVATSVLVLVGLDVVLLVALALMLRRVKQYAI
jgi:ABC-2 type transport system permease protein